MQGAAYSIPVYSNRFSCSFLRDFQLLPLAWFLLNLFLIILNLSTATETPYIFLSVSQLTDLLVTVVDTAASSARVCHGLLGISMAAVTAEDIVRVVKNETTRTGDG